MQRLPLLLPQPPHRRGLRRRGAGGRRVGGAGVRPPVLRQPRRRVPLRPRRSVPGRGGGWSSWRSGWPSSSGPRMLRWRPPRTSAGASGTSPLAPRPPRRRCRRASRRPRLRRAGRGRRGGSARRPSGGSRPSSSSAGGRPVCRRRRHPRPPPRPRPRGRRSCEERRKHFSAAPPISPGRTLGWANDCRGIGRPRPRIWSGPCRCRRRIAGPRSTPQC
mmetsp:Transcript_54138/g.155525  ORF Transcript_54138/g.155525 Transcript_54138/m.155525 type:complete len:218 (-) Transcript_54138:175-828(-)